MELKFLPPLASFTIASVGILISDLRMKNDEREDETMKKREWGIEFVEREEERDSDKLDVFEFE